MKLWFVVLIFGHIAETVGPLPYSMAECQRRIVDRAAELDTTYAQKHLDTDPRMIIDGRHVRRDDIVLQCVAADQRPDLDQ